MDKTGMFISPKTDILDIPPSWGNNKREFRERVIRLINTHAAQYDIYSPRFDIKNPDGTTTAFYPIFCAASPEWNIITRSEIKRILDMVFIERAKFARISAIKEGIDWCNSEYLAWWLEHNIFTPAEIKEIPLEQDIASYIKEFGNPNLTEETVDKLIYPRTSIQKTIKGIQDKITDCWRGNCR